MQDKRELRIMRLGSATGKTEAGMVEYSAIDRFYQVLKWEAAASAPLVGRIEIEQVEEMATRMGLAREQVVQSFAAAGITLVEIIDEVGPLRDYTDSPHPSTPVVAYEIKPRPEAIIRVSYIDDPIEPRMTFNRRSKGDKHRNRRNRWEKG